MAQKSVFDPVVGKTLIAVEQNAYALILVTQDGKRHTFTPEGDCCAHCWIESAQGFDDLIGQVIRSAEDKAWIDLDSEGFDVLEQGFFSLYCDKGAADIELRVSHNGYYGGYFVYSVSE